MNYFSFFVSGKREPMCRKQYVRRCLKLGSWPRPFGYFNSFSQREMISFQGEGEGRQMESIIDAVEKVKKTPPLVAITCDRLTYNQIQDAATTQGVGPGGLKIETSLGTPLVPEKAFSDMARLIQKGVGLFFWDQEEWAAFSSATDDEKCLWVMKLLFEDTTTKESLFFQEAYGDDPYEGERTSMVFLVDRE